MIRLAFLLTLASGLFSPAAGLAEPQVTVRYFEGVAQIQLEGNYALTHYTVWRADASTGPFATAITELSTLCIGACYGEDRTAEPGRTYWYRFDLETQDGTRTSHGPFAVTISPALGRRAGVNVFPNPGSGATRIELYLAGTRADSPLSATATLHDLQGRVRRTLHRGSLARGLITLSWDGLGADGGRLEPGCYFVRFATPLGSTTARVLRVR